LEILQRQHLIEAVGLMSAEGAKREEAGVEEALTGSVEIAPVHVAEVAANLLQPVEADAVLISHQDEERIECELVSAEFLEVSVSNQSMIDPGERAAYLSHVVRPGNDDCRTCHVSLLCTKDAPRES